jgi:hypothetical protein
MKYAKRKERLETRIKDYENTIKNAKGCKWIPEGYKKPGSYNK